jgi:7-cyano-7-deazaguanine reductase
LPRRAAHAKVAAIRQPFLVSKTKKTSGLTLLGHPSKFPDEPSSSILETFPNRNAQRDYLITFESAEFTSMCPVTSQPDFAHLRIEYVADKLCIETKSLKFYLASFRNTRSFNEVIVNRILDDLVAACRPRYVLVHGEFSARGGISVTVDAEYPNRPKQRPPAAGLGRGRQRAS